MEQKGGAEKQEQRWQHREHSRSRCELRMASRNGAPGFIGGLIRPRVRFGSANRKFAIPGKRCQKAAISLRQCYWDRSSTPSIAALRPLPEGFLRMSRTVQHVLAPTSKVRSVLRQKCATGSRYSFTVCSKKDQFFENDPPRFSKKRTVCSRIRFSKTHRAF